MQIKAERSRKTFGKDKCTAYVYKPGKQPGRKPKRSKTTIPALVLQIPPKNYKGFKTYTQMDNAQPARIKECLPQPDKSHKTGRKQFMPRSQAPCVLSNANVLCPSLWVRLSRVNSNSKNFDINTRKKQQFKNKHERHLQSLLLIKSPFQPLGFSFFSFSILHESIISNATPISTTQKRFTKKRKNKKARKEYQSIRTTNTRRRPNALSDHKKPRPAFLPLPKKRNRKRSLCNFFPMLGFEWLLFSFWKK